MAREARSRTTAPATRSSARGAGRSCGSRVGTCDAGPAGWPAWSARVVGGPRLPDHGHLDLARVLELLLDLAGDLVREQHRAVVVERPRQDHDADLAAGLHRVDLVDALVTRGDVLEVAQALDVL